MRSTGIGRWWPASQRQASEPAAAGRRPAGLPLAAYAAQRPRLDRPVELWPRLLGPPGSSGRPSGLLHGQPRAALPSDDVQRPQAAGRLGAVAAGEPCRRLRPAVAHAAQGGVAGRLARCAARAGRTDRGRPPETSRSSAPARECDRSRAGHVPAYSLAGGEPGASLTFARTARRSFETAYWKTIAMLAAGRYRQRQRRLRSRSGHPVAAGASPSRPGGPGRLPAGYHRRVVAAAGLAGRALVGEVPFRWQTDFPFAWSGGWLKNQDGTRPTSATWSWSFPAATAAGRSSWPTITTRPTWKTSSAIRDGGGGPRLAAAGADDNHSATAALMLAAPIFLRTRPAGRLGCDIWLVHLTGEEFPADCMGARHLPAPGRGRPADPPGRRPLAGPLAAPRSGRLRAGHGGPQQRPRPRRLQISPASAGSRCGWPSRPTRPIAIWNASTAAWNRRGGRRGRARGRRSADGVDAARRSSAPAAARRDPARLQSPQHALQHRRPDLLRRRRAGRAVHGELRHQPRRAITTATTRWPISTWTTARRVAAIAIESVARAACGVDEK